MQYKKIIEALEPGESVVFLNPPDEASTVKMQNVIGNASARAKLRTTKLSVAVADTKNGVAHMAVLVTRL